MSLDIASLRKEYTKAELTIESVQREPLTQFLAWFDATFGANATPTRVQLSAAWPVQ
jgi:pyridoxine/pyridoxamine 5'-phosphate oxidase